MSRMDVVSKCKHKELAMSYEGVMCKVCKKKLDARDMAMLLVDFQKRFATIDTALALAGIRLCACGAGHHCRPGDIRHYRGEEYCSACFAEKFDFDWHNGDTDKPYMPTFSEFRSRQQLLTEPQAIALWKELESGSPETAKEFKKRMR